MKKLGAYNKALVVLYLGVLAWFAQVIASKPGPITAAEWLALASIPVVSGVVRQIQNDPIPAPTKPPLEIS